MTNYQNQLCLYNELGSVTCQGWGEISCQQRRWKRGQRENSQEMIEEWRGSVGEKEREKKKNTKQKLQQTKEITGKQKQKQKPRRK